MGSNNNSYTIPVTSFPSHQLSNGLYVSGRPDQYKERAPTMSTAAAPYTGGDIKKSGELGKMFDIPVEAPKLKPSGLVGGAQGKTTGVILSRSHSGPLPSGAPRSAFSTSGPLSSAGASNKPAPQRCNSGPLTGIAVPGSKSGPLITGPSGVPSKSSGPLSGSATPNVLKTSGPLAPQLPATGLITSGPIFSGPLSSSRKVCSGPLDSSASGKFVPGFATNQAINNLSNSQLYSFTRSFPRVILWTVIPLFVMGFIAGGFILAAVQNAILLIVVATLFVALLVLLIWNTCWGSRAILGFVVNFPDTQLNNAKNGQYVKVTGVVTCGSVPLESSFQKVNRCIYTSTGLREYRSSGSKPAKEKQRRFTWALRHLEDLPGCTL
ncbi:hypothetical protein O6H91_06G001000 [Diphasiastrum complanatum]|uniref:Uncharacterized protein n=1 Tax=Diphasiastrum complanatum TaxID=34168 RepID=A0ACC2DA80_DIPCM|nr:hypothetical protein O6H91_06G001000 [Diphasiastrum complanatum]